MNRLSSIEAEDLEGRDDAEPVLLVQVIAQKSIADISCLFYYLVVTNST